MRSLIFFIGIIGFLLCSSSIALAQSPSPTASPTPNLTPTPSVSPSPSPLSSPTPSPQPINIQPSEIMACPTDGDTEWLEVYNAASAAVNLENWKIVDSVANTKTINTSIPAESFGIISWSGSLLNNTGDSVSLVTSSSQTLFTIAHGACTSGRSFVFYNNEWQETTIPTKQAANLYTDPHPSPSPSPSPSPVLSPTPSPQATTNPTSAPLSTQTVLSRPLPTLTNSSMSGSSLTGSSTLDPSLLAPLLPDDLDLTGFEFLATDSAAATPSGMILGVNNQRTPAASLDLETSQDIPPSSTSRAGVISVIMGGLVLVTSGGYYFYETFKQNHQSVV